jgi:hypothetical protein
MSAPTPARRPFAWWRALLLALPLAALLAWLVVGAVAQSFGPDLTPTTSEGGPP